VALTHQTSARTWRCSARWATTGPISSSAATSTRPTEEAEGGVLVLKADAEARTATVITLGVPADGASRVRHRFVDLDSGIAEDPAVAARVEEWLVRHDREYCAERLAAPPGCLDERLALARADLVAEELDIRRFETNFGSWVADRALDAYRPHGAQLAFVNAGSIRLNQDVPAGTWVSRRHVEEMFPYPGDLELLAIDGATLQRVLDHAVSDWTGVGWWLQVAGLAFRHDPATGTARDLTLLAADGPRPIRPDDQLLVVTGAYLVDPSGDQDGYRMLSPEQRVPGAPPYDLKKLVEDALRAAGEEGIAPQVEGRICNPELPGPCLAVGDR
jgi:2',3'-cyclic-nucleotide 2'-phosphodiesterase (5'-nucleotidase family)